MTRTILKVEICINYENLEYKMAINYREILKYKDVCRGTNFGT